MIKGILSFKGPWIVARNLLLASILLVNQQRDCICDLLIFRREKLAWNKLQSDIVVVQDRLQ